MRLTSVLNSDGGNATTSTFVSFVKTTEESPSFTGIPSGPTSENDRSPTTEDSILYNVSVNDDYDTGGFATVAIKELVDKHLKLSSANRETSSTFPAEVNVTESDVFLTVRNVSSLSCLNHNIPSIHEYLAGKVKLF